MSVWSWSDQQLDRVQRQVMSNQEAQAFVIAVRTLQVGATELLNASSRLLAGGALSEVEVRKAIEVLEAILDVPDSSPVGRSEATARYLRQHEILAQALWDYWREGAGHGPEWKDAPADEQSSAYEVADRLLTKLEEA